MKTTKTLPITDITAVKPGAYTNGNGNGAHANGSDYAITPEAKAIPTPPVEIAGVAIPSDLTKPKIKVWLLQNVGSFVTLSDVNLEIAAIEIGERFDLPDGWLTDWQRNVRASRPVVEEVAAPSRNDDSFWTTHPAGEYGNMLCLKDAYGKKIAHNSSYGWMWYSEKAKKWLIEDLADAAVNLATQNMLLERQRRAAQVQNDSIARTSACTTKNISAAKSLIEPHVTILIDDFDSDPWLLNTRSGVIDLRTEQIVASESGRFTYCVETTYDPKADLSVWLNFLDGTIANHKDDENMRSWLQMLFGYSITGSVKEEALSYLYGPTRSGKGTVTNTLLALLGKPLGGSASFSTFTRNRDDQGFDLAPLKPARIIVASEGKKHTPLNEAVIKTVTGRDPISASFKGKTPFTYIPQYKIWLVSNHPVAGDVDDDAFWNRLRVISCPWSKAGSEDKNLKDAMSTPEYLSGVLAYCIRGASMWFDAPKGLITPDCIKRETQRHRDQSDSVGLWLTDNAERYTPTSPDDTGGREGHIKLMASYANWCVENGYPAKKGKAFTASMENKGFKSLRFYESDGSKSGSKQVRGYSGLVLNG